MVDFAKTLLLSCLTEFWTCLCHALLNLKKQPPEVFYVKRPATLLKRRLWHRCFPVNFVKFLRTSFLHNTSEQQLLDLFIYPFIYLDTHLVICISLFISSVYSMIYVQSIYTVSNSAFKNFFGTWQLMRLLQPKIFPMCLGNFFYWTCERIIYFFPNKTFLKLCQTIYKINNLFIYIIVLLDLKTYM